MRTLIALIAWLGSCMVVNAQLCGQDYDAQIAAIHERAAALAGEKPTLVLVGSSSFRFWPQTDTVFATYDVINAGFGGSCFQDAWRLRDTLILAFEPSLVLIYEGDNDLHDGVAQEDILAHATNLLDDLTRRLPLSEFVVVAPKASRARYHLKDQYLELNAKLRSVAMNHGAHWVDFWAVQHDTSGELRDELFIHDKLHLNDEGYAVWVEEMRRQLPWLNPNSP
jgi:lysophospholipase L1-like esterase